MWGGGEAAAAAAAAAGQKGAEEDKMNGRIVATKRHCAAGDIGRPASERATEINVHVRWRLDV